jgi:hypothetical protein
MTTEHNNLVTRIKDLEAQLEAAKLSVWDAYFCAARAVSYECTSEMAAAEADKMMQEREKRNAAR